MPSTHPTDLLRPEAPVVRPDGPRPVTSRADHVAAAMLGAPLTVMLLGLCALQLVCWLPHYVTWPWWADHDVFATMALGWDRGLRPYRDLVGNNFPGTIYLFWAVGKLAGWGRTAPFYMLDAALLLGFGLTLLNWSRRRFGRFLPGAVGLLALLGTGLSLDYTQAAQRDWQGPLLAASALLVAEAWPGRSGRLASAALAAFACSIRPQTALLWPAIGLAVGWGGREPCLEPAFRRVAGWGLALASFGLLSLAPLLFAGVLGDFLRSLGAGSFGGPYNRLTAASFCGEMLRQFELRDAATVLVALLLVGGVSASTRRSVWTWLFAFGLVLLYRPLSPFPHAYLDLPRAIVGSVGMAALAALVLETGPISLPASFRLAAVLAILALGGSFRPAFSNPGEAARGFQALRAGIGPLDPPPGYRENPDVLLSARYTWRDYQAVLDYLRHETTPETRVANVLHGAPALCGPAGRVPSLPAESIAWLNVRPDAEPEFADALASAPADSVVVWAPSELGHDPRLDRTISLPVLEPVIRRNYLPEAAFGVLEVWRRRAD